MYKRQLLEPVGKGWLLNPGEVLGMKGAASWALYDTDKGEARLETV